MPRPVAILLALAASACIGRASPERAPQTDAPPALVRFDFAAPDTVFALAPSLREISGLTALPSGRLAAVQDEAGTVYEIDPASGRVVRETRFRDGGDFEGIEWAEGALWVLRSNGDLHRLAEGEPVETFETPLASRNDCEGLGWDPATRRLLVAAKENPGDGLGRVRAVYAVDPVTRTFTPAPAFTIDRDALDAGGRSFKPSALAVQPGTGHVYVLSSVRKAIAIVDAGGALLGTVGLPEARFPQPEGLAFLPDGRLAIANEGPAGPATLLLFSPVPE